MKSLFRRAAIAAGKFLLRQGLEMLRTRVGASDMNKLIMEALGIAEAKLGS